MSLNFDSMESMTDPFTSPYELEVLGDNIDVGIFSIFSSSNSDSSSSSLNIWSSSSSSTNTKCCSNSFSIVACSSSLISSIGSSSSLASYTPPFNESSNVNPAVATVSASWCLQQLLQED